MKLTKTLPKHVRRTLKQAKCVRPPGGAPPTFEAIEILEPLSLVHVGVERQRRALEQREDGHHAADAVLAVAEDERALRVLLQEVVEVEVLLLQGAVDAGLRQGQGRALLVGQVDDLGTVLHAHLGHQHSCHTNTYTHALKYKTLETYDKMS